MSVQLTPYLAFRSEAREALDFWASVLGGTPTTTRFGDFGVGTPAEADKVMHGRLDSGAGFVLMASDTPAAMGVPSGSAITLSLSGDDAAVLGGWWDALTADGTIVLPLEVAPWGERFGMCTDRFGIDWMVSIATPPAAA